MSANKPGNAYYVPSTAAAILFAVLFGLSTATHFLQGIGYKKVGTDYSHMKIASSRKDGPCCLELVADSMVNR